MRPTSHSERLDAKFPSNVKSRVFCMGVGIVVGFGSMLMALLTYAGEHQVNIRSQPVLGFHIFQEAQEKDDDNKTLIIQVFFGEELPNYALHTMHKTLQEGNTIHLLSIKSTGSHLPIPRQLVTKKLETFNLRYDHDASPDILHYRNKYRPFSYHEPTERRCTERFFWMRNHMLAHNISVALYIDSDVAMLAKAPALPDGCDVVAGMQHSAPNMQWDTVDWSVLAGASILRLDVLDHYLRFVLSMYDPEVHPSLLHKAKHAPYVTDMTLWYLFAGCADERFAADFGFNRSDGPFTFSFPPVSARLRFCDARRLGFDHTHGHRRAEKGLISYHFQGAGKEDAVRLFPM